MLPVMSLEGLVPEHRLRNNFHLQSCASTNYRLCRIILLMRNGFSMKHIVPLLMLLHILY